MNYQNIPDKMKQCPHWIVWRLEDRGGKKPTKTPYSVRGGYARVNDPETWAGFDEALKALQSGQFNGIGFVFTQTPFIGVDIDGCIDPATGEVAPEAIDVLQSMQSYTELSQSGKGFHTVLEGRLPDGRRRNGPFEMYGDGSPRYFAMTGELWGECREIRANQSAIDEIHRKYIAKPINGPEQPAGGQQAPTLELTDAQVLERARAAKNGALFTSLWEGDKSAYDGDDSRADMALCNLLAFWCRKDSGQMDRLFRQSSLMRPKWDERHGRDTYGNITIAEAIAGCRDIYSGPVVSEPVRQQQTAEAPKAEWAPPVSFGEEVLPVFPVGCLPSVMREYVKAVSEAVQVTADMAAVAALATAALCVQKKFLVKGKENWLEPLNLYAVVVAPPAERKSAVMQAMTKFVYEYEQTTNEFLQEQIDRNQVERNILAQSVKELESKAAKGAKGVTMEDAIAKRRELSELEEIKPIRLLADDCTPEVLTSLLSENGGKMAVVSAEGGIFEILNGRYSQSVNIDAFLKAHAGDPLRVDRKGRPSEYIPHPALSVLLAIQPVVLDGLMSNEAFRGRGLTARFLYSIPKSKVGRRTFETPPIPTQCERDFRDLIHSLLSIPQGDKPEIIELSPEAYQQSAAFAAELEPRLCGDLETIGDWAGKFHGAVLRIAGVLHTAQHWQESGRVKLSGLTMQAAITIGRYFLEHAKAAYMLMGADEQIQGAKYVLRQLEKQQYDTISRRDLFRMCRGRFKKSEDITPALELLAEYDYIREIEVEYKGTGRKPDAQYKINPFLYGQNGQNGHNPAIMSNSSNLSA